MQQTDYERRGYLHEDFRLFHLSSALAEDTAFHYHEFHKPVFFLAGAGTTSLRDARTCCGRMMWSCAAGAIHKAQIDPSQRYRRVSSTYRRSFSAHSPRLTPGLDACFRPAGGWGRALSCGREPGQRAALLRTLEALEAEEQSTAYGMTCSHGRRCCSCWSCSAAGWMTTG